MLWIALAILLGFLGMIAVVAVLGARWLEIQRIDVLGEDAARPRPRPRPYDDDDDDEGGDDDGIPPEMEADLVDFISNGPDALTRMQIDEWREEKKREGLSDREIDDLLRNREPLVLI